MIGCFLINLLTAQIEETANSSQTAASNGRPCGGGGGGGGCAIAEFTIAHAKKRNRIAFFISINR